MAPIPAYPYIFSRGLSMSAAVAAEKEECFFLALAESFLFLDWMFSFFIEMGREVWKKKTMPKLRDVVKT